MVLRFPIRISPHICLITAIAFLTVPFPWVIGWIVAVLSHEFSHCVALFLCGIPIKGIYMGNGGARIQTHSLSHWQTILCSLAGPAGGFALLLIRDIFPQAVLCSLILSGYNLLPVFPLDGGRALRSLACLLLPAHCAEMVCFFFEMIVFLTVIVLGIVMTFQWNLGMIPLTAAALFLLRMHRIKIPCKSIIKRVQ